MAFSRLGCLLTGAYAISCQKKPRVACGIPYLLMKYFTLVFLWCRRTGEGGSIVVSWKEGYSWTRSIIMLSKMFLASTGKIFLTWLASMKIHLIILAYLCYRCEASVYDHNLRKEILLRQNLYFLPSLSMLEPILWQTRHDQSRPRMLGKYQLPWQLLSLYNFKWFYMIVHSEATLISSMYLMNVYRCCWQNRCWKKNSLTLKQS